MWLHLEKLYQGAKLTNDDGEEVAEVTGITISQEGPGQYTFMSIDFIVSDTGFLHES